MHFDAKTLILLYRLLLLLLLGISAGSAPAFGAREELRRYETWITGDVITSGVLLLFRTDKPVEGDATRSLVLLATPASLAKGFIPLYVAAAARKIPLRLYGILTHTDQPDYPNAPPITFTAWKLHGAEDPDVLPPDKIGYVRPYQNAFDPAPLSHKDDFTTPQTYSFHNDKSSTNALH